MDAGGATLQVQDNMYSEHKCDAASALYRNDPNTDARMRHYFGKLWKHDIPAYEYIHNNSQKGFIPDHVALGKAVEELQVHEPSIWLRENFGVFHRAACRLNTNNAWYDYLAFQFRLGRGEASPGEIEFANLFIPHFAKAVELARTFIILQIRFNALLSALDHYHIATFVTLPNGTLLLENSEARQILDRKDGLIKDHKGRLRLTGEKDAALRRLITKVAATANCEGMDSEQLLTVSRRCTADPYVLSICPLRDPDNLLEEHFSRCHHVCY